MGIKEHNITQYKQLKFTHRRTHKLSDTGHRDKLQTEEEAGVNPAPLSTLPFTPENTLHWDPSLATVRDIMCWKQSLICFRVTLTLEKLTGNLVRTWLHRPPAVDTADGTVSGSRPITEVTEDRQIHKWSYRLLMLSSMCGSSIVLVETNEKKKEKEMGVVNFWSNSEN